MSRRVTSFAVPHDLWERAADEAARRGWTRSQYVRYLLAQDLGVDAPVPFDREQRERREKAGAK